MWASDAPSLSATIPFLLSSSRARLSVCFVCPVTRTRAPSSARSFAVASPIPLVPPVITARFPWYRAILNLHLVSEPVSLIDRSVSFLLQIRGGLRLSLIYGGTFLLIIEEASR